MNFMDWLKGEVCKCEIESNIDLVQKLKYANDVIYNTNKDKTHLAQQKIELENKVALLTGEVEQKNQAIESLKTELALNQVEPVSEFPNFLENGKVYKPSIRLEDGTYMVVYEPRVMYHLSDILIDKVKHWRTLSEYEKLLKVWEYVVKALKYEYDKTDNWQFPDVTVIREKGDCEDGTVLLVSLARAVGIPAHKIFNAIGPTAFGYHSFSIAYIDKDSGSTLTPGWYIFESTLDFMPKQPKALVGSQYWIDAGLQNWRYAGAIKSGFMDKFNGKYTKTGGPQKEQKIENSEEKRQAIIKYWKEK
jgi:transglutaminase-like putative cysteine protease